jgi:surface polysaccharide O-acyltransferase-like enzyme
MQPAHPVLVSFRVGAVLLALAACDAIPSRVTERLAPLARSSLGVYVIHVPIVYGWFSFEGLAQRIGPRLPFHETALVALAVLLLSLAAERALRRAGAGASATARAWQARSALREEALG